MATPASGVDRWLTVNNRPVSFAEKTENAALNILEYSENVIQITKEAPAQIALWIDGRRQKTAHYGIWNWNPIDYAGLYRIEIQTPDAQRYTTWIRVFPRKLTQRLYEKMKDELSEIALDLLYRLDSPAHERAEHIPRTQDTSPLHDYQQLRSIIEELRDVMAQIRRDPHHTLQSHMVRRDWPEAARFAGEAVPLPGATFVLPPAPARQHSPRHLPLSWSIQERRLTYDTYENRLLKQFLQQQLVAKLALIEKRAENEEKRLKGVYARYHNEADGNALEHLRNVISECQQMRQRCIRWSSEPFLRSVQPLNTIGKATQMLLKHPVYSRFYHLYLLYQMRLKTTRDVQEPVSELAMRRVSDLYEMWSVFTLTRLVIDELLTAGYRMVSNTTFYEVEKDYFQFYVQKDTASIVLVRDELRVTFKYEPVYPNRINCRYKSAVVATIIGNNPLTPDMAIESYKGDIPQDILLFDAKYRRMRGGDRLFYPKDEDIDTMYRYRDRIQYQSHIPGKPGDPHRLEPVISCAYVLYPGDRIHTESDDSIGALPLKPGISASSLAEIRAHLHTLLYDAYLLD